MKNWKYINIGNETIGPNWDKKRQLEDELRGWMTMVNKLDGDERRNAEKQIADIRKELNDVKIKIAHGENKKAGNESIDKQELSMFKGLKKDADKEVGNEYKANPELIKILEAWLHNRISEQEARAKIMKITGDKNITDMMIHRPGGFIPAGNSKTGNETPEEMEVKYKGYTITYFPYQKKYMVRHPNEVSGLVQKHFTSVDEAKKAIDKKAVGNETKGERKFGKVMGEFEEGALKTPQGKTVTDPAQAKAIAYSEADKVDNLKRARNAMVKNQQITLWKGNDSVLISEDGLVQYLESNQFETDRDKYDTQEKAVEELTKKGYRKK